jgi:hypothetical protein
MGSRRVEHQVDDALLALASWAGFLYLRRRFRRLLSHAVISTIVAGAVGAIGVAGAAAAWFRSRAHSAAE